ncbi:MAG TPA: histidine kinase dimerization/phospho-acceptor domain-containing protein, partial [Pyrinomonadaceae bacterium]|nr:histidine kinase dimerization/phospho-acceptor domain-containing protein [Pyrinomonadaceae bacterium]
MTFPENFGAQMAAAGIASPEDVLQSLLETAREAVLIVEGSTRISAANLAAAHAFAWQDGTLVGKRLSEVIRNPSLHEAFQQAVQSGSSDDIKIEIADPEKHVFDVHVAPIDIGGSRYAAGVFYDVTQIERLERVRQEFLSNISHELRTPLTAIMAFVETLEDGAIDDKENNRRFLGVIRRNAERMHALIADILELSLIESGNVSIDRKQVDLSQLVSDIFSTLSAKAADRNISVINAVKPDAVAAADPARLDQMLTNLIDNAIKFNRAGGSVTVRF